MNYFYYIALPVGFFSILGGLGYLKIFGIRKYKVIKDYEYRNSRVQLIKNPQHNVCGVCFDILEENQEIGRFPRCDHHFCDTCIHKQIDDSQSDLKHPKRHPCSMCMNSV